MSRSPAALLLAPLLLAAGCAATGGRTPDFGFDRAGIVGLFVRWREGERRRDPEMAQSVLHFGRSGDRAFHRKELEALQSVYAGPIRTAVEIHLVGAPDPIGPGDYLFLEPAGRGHVATFLTVVSVRGAPRILYRRPAVSEEQRRTLRPREVAGLTVRHRIAFWESLDGGRLAEEVERTKRMLRYQIEAESYAKENEVALPAFAPRPGDVLQWLEPLDAEQARERIVTTLKGALKEG